MLADGSGSRSYAQAAAAIPSWYHTSLPGYYYLPLIGRVAVCPRRRLSEARSAVSVVGGNGVYRCGCHP